MTIRHLLIFQEVASCGNMSAAAMRLFLSQPTVSQAIGELETHYGVRLFERFPRKLVITPAGEKLLGYTNTVLKDFHQMEQAMVHSGEETPLRIGASVTVGTCILGKLIQQYEQEDDTGRKTFVWVNNTASVEQELLNGNLDLGMVEGKIKSADFVCRPVMEDHLVLVCAKEHPLAGKKKLSLRELSGQDFILREEGSGTRELFLNDMNRLGVEIHAKWICNNAGAIKQAVIDGQGLSVISFRLVEQEVRDGKIAVLPQKECSWKREFQLVYHKRKYVTAQMEEFLKIVEKFALESQKGEMANVFTKN